MRAEALSHSRAGYFLMAFSPSFWARLEPIYLSISSESESTFFLKDVSKRGEPLGWSTCTGLRGGCSRRALLPGTAQGWRARGRVAPYHASGAAAKLHKGKCPLPPVSFLLLESVKISFLASDLLFNHAIYLPVHH